MSQSGYRSTGARDRLVERNIIRAEVVRRMQKQHKQRVREQLARSQSWWSTPAAGVTR